MPDRKNREVDIVFSSDLFGPALLDAVADVYNGVSSTAHVLTSKLSILVHVLVHLDLTWCFCVVYVNHSRLWSLS